MVGLPSLLCSAYKKGLQGGYYAAERHANLALLSLKGVAATPKGSPSLGGLLVVWLMALP